MTTTCMEVVLPMLQLGWLACLERRGEKRIERRERLDRP